MPYAWPVAWCRRGENLNKVDPNRLYINMTTHMTRCNEPQSENGRSDPAERALTSSETGHGRTGHDVTLIAGPSRPPAGEGDLGSMLTVALDGLIELCEAERGMIVLFSPDGEVLLGKARTRTREDLEPSRIARGLTIMDEVRKRGVISWQSNVLAHPVMLGLHSAHGLKPLAMGCVGVREGQKACGLVYLDRGKDGAPFRRETLQLVEWLAQLVSIAVTRKLEGPWRWRFLDATKRYSS